MDPVTLIVTALVAGASAALKEAAGSAASDAYQALKRLVARKFTGEKPAPAALESPEVLTQAQRGVLEEDLRAQGLEADEQALAAAQHLLAIVDPEGSRTGKYSVTVSGGQGVVVGDHANVTMRFGDD